jgi:uncharacterized protein
MANPTRNPKDNPMSCTENTNVTAGDPLEVLDDAVAAAAFRRLVRHLRHRHDAQNIELMGLAGFCRNCLADWIVEAGAPLDKAGAREVIHGMAASEWKARFQSEATPEQLARMAESVAKNHPSL